MKSELLPRINTSMVVGGLIILLGGSILVIHFDYIASQSFDFENFLFVGLLPTSVSISIVVLGSWVVFNQYSLQQTVDIVMGLLVIGLSFGGVTVVVIMYQSMFGTDVIDTGYVLVNNVSFGILLGGLMGLQRAKIRGVSIKLRNEREHLESKREQLEALNRIVRHDIRNDIQLIIGLSETCGTGDGNNAEKINMVQNSARHAVELTETAKDFIESLGEDEKDSLEDVELGPVLEEQIQYMHKSYDNVEIDGPGDVDTKVKADTLLSSVFRNLMTNAVQHNSADKPKINIQVTQDDSTVVIKIGDNGEGIPEDMRDAVFGRGEKGLDSEGTGVGLYLVDTLVGMYNGEVEISDSPMGGALFTMELNRSE